MVACTSTHLLRAGLEAQMPKTFVIYMREGCMQVNAILEQDLQALVFFLRDYGNYEELASVVVHLLPAVLTSLQLLSGSLQLPASFREQMYHVAVQIVLSYAAALLLRSEDTSDEPLPSVLL